MGKGIIIVDIPKSCRNIHGDKNGCTFGGMVCQIKHEDVMKHVENGTKPSWCPIREMPVRLEEINYPHSMNDYQMKGFSRGFNACLDKLEWR